MFTVACNDMAPKPERVRVVSDSVKLTLFDATTVSLPPNPMRSPEPVQPEIVNVLLTALPESLAIRTLLNATVTPLPLTSDVSVSV